MNWLAAIALFVVAWIGGYWHGVILHWVNAPEAK
jgi:hypothetical protein